MTAEEFIALRLRAGCSQRVWATLLGVSHHTVKRIEYVYTLKIPQVTANLATLLGDATIRARALSLLSMDTDGSMDSSQPSKVAARLAALERQLQQYLVKSRPVTHRPSTEYRARLGARAVILKNLRRQRALHTNGHERGWACAILTQEDWARAAMLLQQKENTYVIS